MNFANDHGVDSTIFSCYAILEEYGAENLTKSHKEAHLLWSMYENSLIMTMTLNMHRKCLIGT